MNNLAEGKATDRDWIEYLVNDASIKRPEDGIPTFDELLVKRRHLLKHRPHTQNVAFEKNIRDIENNPFPTPSGKIEIFSKRLYEMKNSEIPALSHYVPAIEGPEDTLTDKFPLQLITWKGRNRANSTQFANPWLQEYNVKRIMDQPIRCRR